MNGSVIFSNIKETYRSIYRAAVKCERDPAGIKLVAVTKTVGIDAIISAIESGLRIFGENRVQEAKQKIRSDEAEALSEKIEWHLIGHLQKNKAKEAVGLFDLIHSVDSGEIAASLDRHAGNLNKIQRVLVQVKLSDEESKYGIDEAELIGLLHRIRDMKNLKLEGLMTIPPYFEAVKDAQPYFRRLREIRDSAEEQGFSLPELSMGMSHDFEAAIEEGATYLRIGTAIFGERNKI